MAPPQPSGDRPSRHFSGEGESKFRIVLLAGFETFNRELYRRAADRAAEQCPGLEIWVCTERDIASHPEALGGALKGADIVFCSLVFDFDQVNWMQERIADIPIRFVFESALELMSFTQVGSFTMAAKPGKKQGMPPAVKALLSKFSSTREEDRLDGYTKFLKSGPKLLKMLPGDTANDLRRWLETYAFWNAGGTENIASMFILPSSDSPEGSGLVHPDRPGYYFSNPKEYLGWCRPYPVPARKAADWPVVSVLLYRKHVVSELPYIPELVRHMEGQSLLPLPLFITGVDGHIAVRDSLTSQWETDQVLKGEIPRNPTLSPGAVNVDAVVSTIGFPLVGGPAGSMEGARQAELAKEILLAKNVPYFVAAPLLIQDIKSWFEQGIGGLQSVVLYALPELDGAIDTIPLGGLCCDCTREAGEIRLVPERLLRLTSRIQKWTTLRKKEAKDRKVAVVLYGYPPGIGATGTAALLNVPRQAPNPQDLTHSHAYQYTKAGYDVGEIPESPEDIVETVSSAWVRSDGAWGVVVRVESVTVRRVSKNWGGGLDRSGIRTVGSGSKAEFLLGGCRFGNVWVGVQPPLGVPGDPMRLLFERDMTPHPQYAAFYKWLENEEAGGGFGADAVVHFGMHGTEEWLPGTPLGNTGECWPDLLTGGLPNVYVYAANNPSESLLAKRRGYGTLVSHNVPPYSRAGLYKELQLDAEEGAPTTEGALLQTLFAAGLEADCPPPASAMEALQAAGTCLEAMAAHMVKEGLLDPYCEELKMYLAELETRLFSEGLHTLGSPPSTEALRAYLVSALHARPPPEHRSPPCVPGLTPRVSPRVSRVIFLVFFRNTEEISGVLRALNGEYVPPAPGGDLLRDGSGVLPTGRNIHALDPFRIPSKVAMARGNAAAKLTLDMHQRDNEDPTAYPETVSVNLWGLEAIKTRGESVALVLALVGARPLMEATGRVVKYELIPLEELGRPRVDVLASLSGDHLVPVVSTFSNGRVHAAATADEPVEKNFIKKHALELQAAGETASTARIFSNPPGEFGSMVNERVSDSSWTDEGELGETWASRNAFSFGRDGRGVSRRNTLNKLMMTTSTVVQNIDSVEYGLTDIQEYYANTGAMVRAMDDIQGGTGKVQATVVESFSRAPRPKKINDVLRLEYRAKLLNPKWAESMVAQGSGGAFEVSQRMTAMVGWGATTKFREKWVFDQSAETYALDPEMADKLRKANPEAFKNIVGRLIEASSRGMWDADSDTLAKLQDLYSDMDDQIEMGSMQKKAPKKE
ncbi:magnesium-chelatase, subunit H [Baffinella frigidus]|nr:magnesium-chelatase, subunit H [Cryptophyta sp. CCMP2293]